MNRNNNGTNRKIKFKVIVPVYILKWESPAICKEHKKYRHSNFSNHEAYQSQYIKTAKTFSIVRIDPKMNEFHEYPAHLHIECYQYDNMGRVVAVKSFPILDVTVNIESKQNHECDQKQEVQFEKSLIFIGELVQLIHIWLVS